MKQICLLVGVIAAMSLPSTASAQRSAADLTAPLAAPDDPLAYYADREAASVAMEERDFAEAEPLLQRLTSAYPLDADTWAELAFAQNRLGKSAEAIAAYQRVMALAGPGYARARTRISALYVQLADYDAALDWLEQMVMQDAYLDRPGLISAGLPAPMRDDPRFRVIAGDIDTSGMTREQGWRTDLDFLLSEIHRLSPRHRDGELPAEVVAVHRQLYADAGSLSDEQMYAGVSRLVGALNQNHTMMWGLAPGRPPAAHPILRYLPVQLYFFPEGVFVIGAGENVRDLVGAQLLAIDGTPTLAAFAQVRETMSVGGASEALASGPLRLIDAALLNGLGVTQRPERASLRLRLRDGRTVTQVLDTVTEPIVSKLPPPPRVTAPPFLTHAAESHWLEVWPDAATVYAQVSQMAPDEDETLPAFGLRLRSALAESNARNVIVDLRLNNGGDTFTYVELLRTLLAFSVQEGHKVYVLIGRNTYSAAVNFTTDLERLANPVFVGEPTGATGNQEGDEGAIRLPYSGLRANIAGVLWQLSHPWDERRFIAPDAPVQLTAADYFAGRDPALEITRALIARR